jgi:hypothetical protein
VDRTAIEARLALIEEPYRTRAELVVRRAFDG